MTKPSPSLARYRMQVLSRTLAAAGGGYVLMSSSGFVLARAFAASGLSRPDAVMGATLIGFILFCIAAMWCFGTRSARRAWAGTVLPSLALIGLVWALGTGGQP